MGEVVATFILIAILIWSCLGVHGCVERQTILSKTECYQKTQREECWK